MIALFCLLSLLVHLWDRFDRRLCYSLPDPLRLRWVKLWVRKDEFHPSLDYNPPRGMDTSSKKHDDYCNDLGLRREEAHWKDFKSWYSKK